MKNFQETSLLFTYILCYPSISILFWSASNNIRFYPVRNTIYCLYFTVFILFLALYVINQCLMMLIVQNILRFHNIYASVPSAILAEKPWCEVAWISCLITLSLMIKNFWFSHPYDSRNRPPTRILFQDSRFNDNVNSPLVTAQREILPTCTYY